MSYQVIARKYRPQKFSDVIGQDHITRTLQNAIGMGRLHHAYLFTGVRGVGKTTLARILSKALNCKGGSASEPCNKCPSCEEITNGSSMDVQEIDGASNTGVDDVREIRERVKYLPSSGKYKIYIIDEVHMLSTAAFNALLKTLEEPPEHVIFIFATTEPNKIPATILSRCQRYDFRRIHISKIVEALKSIAKSEGIEINDDAMAVVAHEAEGSMRDAESLFDQAAAYAGKKITYDHLKELLGFLDRRQIDRAVRAIVEKDAGGAMAVSNELFQTGANLNRFTTELMQQFRNLLVIKAGGGGKDGTNDILPEDLKLFKDVAEKVTIEECQQWFNVLYHGAEDIARTKFPKILLDVLLIRMTQARPVHTVDELLERVERMENGHQVCHPQVCHPRESGDPVGAGENKANIEGATYAQFLNWLKVNKPQVASFLEQAADGGTKGSILTIKFPERSLYGDMLSDPEKKTALEKLATDFFKKDTKINIEFSGNGGEAKRVQDRRQLAEKQRLMREEAMSHEIVREATSLFGAEIKEIKVKE